MHEKRLLKKNRGISSKRIIHETNCNWDLCKKYHKIIQESKSKDKNVMKENVCPNIESRKALRHGRDRKTIIKRMLEDILDSIRIILE